jgi:chromate transporter
MIRPMTESVSPPNTKTSAPSFGQALRWWLWLGCISFGGPAGQIATMHEELVVRRRWISEGRFLHALNYCMVLPGPEAQQLATYIGWLMHGVRGALAAGGLFVLPSLLVLCGLSWIYASLGHTAAVSAVLWGVKPVVVAIVLAAAIRVGKRTLKHPALWLIAAAALICISLLQWPFPVVIVLAALAGIVLARRLPEALGAPSHGPAVGARQRPGKGADAAGAATDCATQPAPAEPLLADEDAPPSHAAFSLRRLAVVSVAFLAIWLSAMLVLIGIARLAPVAAGPFAGLADTAIELAWFHTKAALLTFGGAYAVLPYVYQMAVDHYHWLSAAQMIDGLALGETTPGPLIMVVAFVGWMAGWSKTLPGADLAALAGLAGACVATFFTFLPSFFFILAGGPFVERSRGELGLKAPLAGITAAVVGVIASLGLFLTRQVLWPGGASIDWAAAAIVLAAALALTRWNWGVVQAIAAGAALGAINLLLAGS